MPPWQAWTFERILLWVGSVASIIGVVLVFLDQKLGADFKYLIIISELVLIVLVLAVFIFITHKKNLHRYAQAIFYMHFINHRVRDQMAILYSTGRIELNELLQDVVDETANCFSIITAKRCRCCIKEVRADGSVFTVV